MDDKDLQLQRMRQELAKWKGRTLEACEEVCMLCGKYAHPEDEEGVELCRHCRTKKIKEEATR